MKKIFCLLIIILFGIIPVYAENDYSNGYGKAVLNRYDITWILVDKDGYSTYVGIENIVTDNLPDPANFCVQILTEKDLVDKEYQIIRDDVRYTNRKDKFIDFYIESEEGIIYTSKFIATLYIEIGDQFDAQEITEMFSDYSVKKIEMDINGENKEFMQVNYGVPVTDSNINTDNNVNIDNGSTESSSNFETIFQAPTVFLILGLFLIVITGVVLIKSKQEIK